MVRNSMRKDGHWKRAIVSQKRWPWWLLKADLCMVTGGGRFSAGNGGVRGNSDGADLLLGCWSWVEVEPFLSPTAKPSCTELPYNIPLSDQHIVWLRAANKTLTWPGVAFSSCLFLPDPVSPSTSSPESYASADVIYSSVPGLSGLAAVPTPRGPQDPQLAPVPSRAQQGTQALPSSTGELSLRSHKQSGLTEVSPEMEPVGFAQTYATARHQSVGHYWWSTVWRICGCRLKMVSSAGAIAQLYRHD